METQARDTINVQHRRIDPRKIALLELNAHYMRNEVFSRLVDNIKSDGAATSSPFLWRVHDDATRKPLHDPEDDGAYLALSGNHRVKAAIAADLPEINVLYSDDYLTPDRRRAIQLSHNAIFGEDDPAVLKAVYDGIGDYSMRVYYGLDDKQLKILDDVNIAALTTANLEFQTITMLFLPNEIGDVTAVWDAARKTLAGSKTVWLARWQEYDAFMDGLDTAGRSYDVKNTATALMLILEVFSRHLDELTDGYLDELGAPVDTKRKVPIETVLGSNLIPAAIAAKLKKRIENAKHEHTWQVLDDLLTD